MKKSIWDSYNFSADHSMGNGSDTTNKVDVKFKDFETILYKVLENKIGKIDNLSMRICDWGTKNKIDIKIGINCIATFYINDSKSFIIIDTILTSGRVEIILPIEFFQTYVEQIIEKISIPIIKDFYKKDIIKTIPDVLLDNTNIDLSKISSKWFKETFEDISENVGNQEEVDEIKIVETDSGITISFGLDCHRYGYYDDNIIKVSKKGNVKTNLAEIIEGNDIDGRIQEEIEKLIRS